MLSMQAKMYARNEMWKNAIRNTLQTWVNKQLFTQTGLNAENNLQTFRSYVLNDSLVNKMTEHHPRNNPSVLSNLCA